MRLRTKIFISVVWLAVLTYGIIEGYSFMASDYGYRPAQPVQFSHKTHSGDFGIKCLYCHSSAERQNYSQISTTNECLACHIALKAETELMEPVNFSYDEEIPIPWTQVYRLPDYAHFSHSSHIRAMIDCSSCHGPVDTMSVMQRKAELTMKWCIDCHRDPLTFITPARDISGIFTWDLLDSSEYKIQDSAPAVEPFYGGYLRINYITKQGITVPRFPMKGTEDCSDCHY